MNFSIPQNIFLVSTTLMFYPQYAPIIGYFMMMESIKQIPNFIK